MVADGRSRPLILAPEFLKVSVAEDPGIVAIREVETKGVTANDRYR